MSAVKVAVLGAGSTYTPELIEGFIQYRDKIDLGALFLMDIDKEKLGIVGSLARRMLTQYGLGEKVTLTTDLDEALTGADFVIVQIRVDGLDARHRDETLPLKYNCIGQETVGAGGFACALRTIPVVLDIADKIAQLAPSAYLINFTNPSGIITEALCRHTKLKVIGLCNIPLFLKNKISLFFDKKITDIHFDYFGLNHLSWVRKVLCNGEELKDFWKVPVLLANFSGMGIDEELIKTLEMLPSPYLAYYYHKEKKLAEQLNSPQTRAQTVQNIEKELLEMYKNPNLAEKPKLLEKRGGALYSQAAVSLIAALLNDEEEIHILNVPNSSAVEDFAEYQVLEIPVSVKKGQLKPLKIGKVPDRVKGLMQLVKNYEELTVNAAVQNSFQSALFALLTNPLVSDFAKARSIVQEIFKERKGHEK